MSINAFCLTPSSRCIYTLYNYADGEMVFNPSADTIIRSDEKVIAVGSSDDLDRLEKALNP